VGQMNRLLANSTEGHLYGRGNLLLSACLVGMAIVLVMISNAKAQPNWEDLSPVNPVKSAGYDEGVYNECILKNTKVAGLSRFVLRQIQDACQYKATPKICRDYVLKPWEEYSGTNECISKCKTAGWWSRKYGDCSTD
jgi:hypothetical protein